MKTHAMTHPHALHAAAPRDGLSAPVRFVMDRFLLVPIGAAIALIWANTAGESYFRFAHALAFPVNQIGMALFLALVTQEAIEATMPGGALHSWRRWSTPLVAAAGGMAGAALAYLGFVFWKDEQMLWQAWPIACAIDLVAAYYVLKFIAPRSAMLPFVLLLAIATNAAALVVMAAWPAPTPGHLAGAGLLAAGIATAALLRRSGVRVFWPYFAVSGVLAWFGFLLADVHPALALIPIVPFMPHAPRGVEFLADTDDGPIHHAEHRWNEAVQVIVFLFALVNAGVLLGYYDTGTWAVLVAALVGRPLGILIAVALAVSVGFHLPRGVTWRHLLVIAVATSSGFTLALFFATGLLPIGAILQQIKVGALATVAGALAAIALGRVLGVGRFHHRRAH